MTVTFKIAPDVEQAVKAQAIARGIAMEDYLPSLIAQAAQEIVWEEIGAARQTMAGMETVARRLWNMPGENSGWSDL